MGSLQKPKGSSNGSFYIRTKKAKSGSIRWYVSHQSYVNNVSKQKSVPKNLYHQFGFNPEMSVIEAKERCKQLNQERRLEAGAYVRSARNAEEHVLIDKTFFPENQVEEFLYVLEEQTHGSETHYQKLISHFILVQKMIKDLKITPANYGSRSNKFYKYFVEKKYSVDYTSKIIRILNMWGRYVAKQQGSFFEVIKAPRGRARSKIEEAQMKKKNVKRESLLLTNSMLNVAKGSLSKEHYNWLYLSVWLGLRPKEIDELKNEDTYKIEKHEDIMVLSVYQSKLMEIEYSKRWKHIPLIYPEQTRAMMLIKNEDFKRPHSKTVQKHIKKGVTLYGGRKGFEELMLSRGQKFEDVADWLGHKSLDTTFKHYRNRKKVRYTKVD